MADQSTGPNEAAKPPRAERKALMLSATIEAGPLKAPVRIRNLSESGAMIEGVTLPPVGSATTLQRNEIEIGGSVVWQSGRRAGIHFNGSVSVEEWIAGVKKPPEAMRGQTRVDAIQAAARAGQPVVESTPVERTARAEVTEIDTAIADEIAYVLRMLETVASELADDPLMISRHGAALQSFDIACQILGQLGVIISAGDRSVAIDHIVMQDLRSRLLRKPLF